MKYLNFLFGLVFFFHIAQASSPQGAYVEQWDVYGVSVQDLLNSIDFPSSPSEEFLISSSEYEVSNNNRNLGRRVRFIFTVPETGKYSFSIAAKESAELWLSLNGNQHEKKLVAALFGPVSLGQFEKKSAQQSISYNLVQGQELYFELLHKSRKHNKGDYFQIGYSFEGSEYQVFQPEEIAPFTPSGYESLVKSPEIVLAGQPVVVSGGNVNLKVNAWAKEGLENIEFLVNGVSKGVDAEEPYEMLYTPDSLGQHTVVFRATGLSGNVVDLASSQFYVASEKGHLNPPVQGILRGKLSKRAQLLDKLQVAGGKTANANLPFVFEGYGEVQETGYHQFAVTGPYRTWLFWGAAGEESAERIIRTMHSGSYKSLLENISPEVFVSEGDEVYLKFENRYRQNHDETSLFHFIDNEKAEPIQGSALTPKWRNEELPVVEFTYPYRNWRKHGTRDFEYHKLTRNQLIKHEVSAYSGNVVLVETYNGSELIGSSNIAPFTVKIDAFPPGQYNLWSKAYDSEGRVGISDHLVFEYDPADSDNNGLEDGSFFPVADRDLDGVYDNHERYNLGTSYRDVDLDLVEEVSISGAEMEPIQGNWVASGANIATAANAVLGKVGFSFDVSSPDIYYLEFDVEFQKGWIKSQQHIFKFWLDGELVKIFKTPNYSKQIYRNKIRIFSPYLKPGNYSAEFAWEHYREKKGVVIHGFKASRINIHGDSDNSRKASWVSAIANKRHVLPDQSITSKVSPACVEGETRFLNGGNAISNGMVYPLNRSVGDEFFVNIPLNSQGGTEVEFDLGNGALSGNSIVSWAPTSLGENLDIRVGDSLKMTVFPFGVSEGTGQIFIDGQTFTVSGNSPYVFHQFTSAGNYVISGDYISPEGVVTTFSSEFRVFGGTVVESPVVFQDPFGQKNSFQRRWIWSHKPELFIESGDVPLTQIPGEAIGTYLVDKHLYSRHGMIVSRVGGAAGPILQTVPVRHSVATYSGHMDKVLYITERYEDGTQLVEGSIYCPDLPEGASLKVDIWLGGVAFDDGARSRHFTSEDFADGVATYRLYRPADSTKWSVCHTVYGYHQGYQIYKK